jgi:hypothetical protein
MERYCENCRCKISDIEDNTDIKDIIKSNFCLKCQDIILPFINFINKKSTSAVKFYEANKRSLTARGITESGLLYILNYCKYLDNKKQQDLINDVQPILIDEIKNNSEKNQLISASDEIKKTDSHTMRLTASSVNIIKKSLLLSLILFFIIALALMVRYAEGGSQKSKTTVGICDNCGILMSTHNIGSYEYCDNCYDDFLERLIKEDKD